MRRVFRAGSFLPLRLSVYRFLQRHWSWICLSYGALVQNRPVALTRRRVIESHAIILSLLLRGKEQPGYAKLIGNHAKLLSEERFAQRQLHFAALTELVEYFLGLAGGNIDRQRDAIEFRQLARTMAIGHHDLGVANLHVRVHDLFFCAWRHTRFRLRI